MQVAGGGGGASYASSDQYYWGQPALAHTGGAHGGRNSRGYEHNNSAPLLLPSHPPSSFFCFFSWRGRFDGVGTLIHPRSSEAVVKQATRILLMRMSQYIYIYIDDVITLLEGTLAATTDSAGKACGTAAATAAEVLGGRATANAKTTTSVAGLAPITATCPRTATLEAAKASDIDDSSTSFFVITREDTGGRCVVPP